MPESRGRPKRPSSPPPGAGAARKKTNPPWYTPVMLGLMVVGLLWVVTYYVSGAHQFPVPSLGRWNLGVGFGFILAGFMMTTNWQ